MTWFVSTNVGGNVHAACDFVNRAPDVMRDRLFQVIGFDSGSNSIVIFKAESEPALRAIEKYLGHIPRDLTE